MEFLKTVDLTNTRYVEAIKDGEIIKVSERVAREEDLFVLRRLEVPAVAPAIPNRRIESVSSKSASYLSEWKIGKVGYKRNNVVSDLVDNFQWEISKQRRMKNISRKQLADAVHANEEEIKFIELGQLPRDDFVLISRIENYFKINLRKNKDSGKDVNLAQLQKMQEQKVKPAAETSKLADKAGKPVEKKGFLGGLFGKGIDIVE